MSAPAAIMRNNAQVTGMVLSKCLAASNALAMTAVFVASFIA
jgi:hypothetical protein